MIEVIIDSIRVSLMSQHRVVVLKDMNSERYLPIWIGPCEAEAITVKLQEVPAPRPLTHDLLRNVIRELGGKVVHILINDLRQEVYYARIVIDVAGEQMEIDSREEKDQYGLSMCHAVGLPNGSLISAWSCQTRIPPTPVRRQRIRPISGLSMKRLMVGAIRQRLSRWVKTFA